MNYEMFVEQMAEVVKEHLPEGWEHAKVSIVTNDKVNCQRTGILFERVDRNCSPTIYMEEFYRRYQNGMDWESLILKICEVLKDAERETVQALAGFDFANSEEKIIFQLINTKENEALLEEMPHRSFHDLSIVYQWVLLLNEDEMASIPIDDNLAARYDLSEERLYQLAKENTKRLFPVVVKPITKVVRELIGFEKVQKTEAFDVDKEISMHVISNNVRSFGANAILYPEKIHKVAERLGEDLYILPSSRHEVIALPKSAEELHFLSELVYEINMTQVELDEILSHQVYQYDRDAREVTMATNLPYRPFAKESEKPNQEEIKERSTRR